MKVIERAVEIDKLNEVEVPYYVWALFGDGCKTIRVIGSKEISLGEDYTSIDQIRIALDWYADHFGGKVKWKK